MKRMRDAAGVYAILKEIDPDTKISKNFIRRCIICEICPVLKIGRRRLVDADQLIEHICNGDGLPDPDVPQAGSIRRVAV